MFSHKLVESYKMEFVGKPDFWTMAKVWGNSAKAMSEARISRWYRRPSKGEGIGIGDLVVPSKGPFAGMPLICQGFTCEYMEPMFGLPAGKCSALIVETFYKDGVTTGLRFYLPQDEI